MGNIYIKEQGMGDQSTRAGEQLIINTMLAMVEKHKNLLPGEKESFALAFKKVNNSLASY
jgi:hypothetical protein